ncbi:uncharacterized protein SPPG_01674 [Spizellomyces punctatus DAOM BR117]|uniref:Calcium-activated potassium channel BK alpha subunit domain-containing protein n=1 Tax=Spizellomyces punctatus (strain DAOM BR117) TaxID=645134 RepID=A0A0L0HT08_SPIPD|nr:uncharacterized protein SPPG_01674 [Spizellomyces punctatus DAOM BR117]KND04243.1 hypothetical protein SPPG_01674 [Spizellomyces punctatus DAOM BR117]|eukprot:XP_016612282.1 hypothetical protein SPPG_01674 [Spizellomyces punctatus DAOM BR117]
MSADDPLIDPDTLLPVNGTLPIDEEAIVKDARWYNVILWAPFVLIPFTIILSRVLRYLWRLYQARVYGYDEDLFSDPLAELGLSITRHYRNTTDIRKIRKEQRKIHSKQQRAERAAAARETGPARRFIAGFAPLNAAESYFQDLRKRTKRTWSERLSPEAVRRWIDTSRYARIWMVFQVVCTLLAIVNYVLLTYSIHRTDRRHIKYLDLFLASMFLIDYSISLYTSEDRLRFYFNPGSLVDLLSIVPPFVYVLISETSQYVWFLGLLRILRASRILRTYRLLSFSETEEKRELTILALSFMNFVFLSASIINALESIHNQQINTASLSNWHDSLYYIMVTFSTIGFGDLTPSSVPSRVVVMLLIIVVVVFVPIQTGKIAEIYNSTSAYQRAKYSPESEHAHVILGGTVSYTAVIDFCREYFVADPEGHVVILNEEEPSLDVRKLLRHPFYRNRVIYLRGTALSIPDLRRAQATFATALFLLNLDSPSDENSGGGNEDEQLRVTRGVDAQILMQALVAKNAFPGLPIFGEVQDIRSQDLSQTCGCDRVLCIDEVKMSILARNCLVPGILTLILNLVHTYKDARMTYLSDAWTTEYQHGAGHQVYSFKVPTGLVGVRFPHVVREVYHTFGAIVFAVMSSNAGFNVNPIRLNPGKDYRLRDDDIAFCAADGGDELMLRIMLQYKDTAIRDELNLFELGKEMDKVVVGEGPSDILKTASENFNTSAASLQPDPTPSPLTSSPTTVLADPGLLSTLHSHIILCGSMTSRGIRHFVRSIRTSSISTPSRALSASESTPIICLLETIPAFSEDGIWSDILQYPHVFIVRGTPLKRTSLLQAGVERCAKVVVFAKNQKGGAGNAQDLPDANSVFIVKMLQREWPQTSFIVELSNGSNVKFFSSKNSEWNSDNLRMQSILNNYALSINDRVALYKKVRAEGAERATNFLYRLIQFTASEPTPGAGIPTGNPSSKSEPKRSKRKRPDTTGQVDEVLFAGEGAEMGMADLSPKNYKNLPTNLSELESDENSDQDEPVSETQQQQPPSNTSPVSTAYLQRLVDEAELNETGLSPFPAYHFDRHFAAGMVTTSCFMHSLLAQSYFRPYVVDIVRALSTSAIHIRVPPECVGKKYMDLVGWCLERGIVPLGLYRGALSRSERPAWGGETDGLPYVYTNCRSFDVVRKDDLVFVVREGS